MPHFLSPERRDSGTDDPNSVAVIGLACRFPSDAENGPAFWDFLCKARSAYSEPNRFNINAFHSTAKGRLNTTITRGAHFLRQDVAAFDANFFSISQNEAIAMDPNQRFMLEVAYEAFENAGLPLESIAGSNTSCHIGNYITDYREMLFRDTEAMPLYSMSGSGAELISNRVSWFYDLRGPSFTLGTACSSSLVAVHQGCQSLRTGEANTALVGGSNLLLNPDMFVALSNQQFLAQDGRSKSFDIRGDGYGRGEGFAALILKRVDDAIRDGDPIRAIIRGTGVNQDGKTKSITVPSAEAQADLIRSTYHSAGLSLNGTDYFEAHGTGTKAGDPLELRALSDTLAAGRTSDNKLIVGSVKSNIGHLEATAGLAGIIKSIYILEHAMIPPTIHFHQANPRIPFDEWNIQVPTKVMPWPTEGQRRISVQSFGYGGTNAHAILDDAFHYLEKRKLKGYHFTKPSIPKSSTGSHGLIRNQATNPSIQALKLKLSQSQKRLRLFVLSAQDQDGLNRQKKSLSAYLRNSLAGPTPPSAEFLRDLAFTLGHRRSRLAWKTYLTASTPDELLSNLENKSLDVPSFRPSTEPRIGFVFTGQGAQWAKMGAELNQYPIFRESVQASDEYLRSNLKCKWSAVEELFREEHQSNVNLPAYSQPICTILQIALVDLLESWNIVPCAITGHSSGEIAGAYCLGALSKEDALKAAYYRGLLSSQMKTISPSVHGSMMAVGASESEAEDWIARITSGDVVVACVNSPSSVTISGDTPAINELEAMLKKEGIFARKLKVETAYHSPHMEMISVPYLQSMMDIQPQNGYPSRKMYSAVTGELVEPSELGPINWVRNLVSPVLFYDALYDLLRPMESGRRSSDNAVDVLLEIGPHAALQGPANQTMKNHGIKGVDYRSVLSRGKNGIETTLAAVGALFCQSLAVNVQEVNGDTNDAQPLVDLPSYNWNHSRTYWSESRITKESRFRQHPRMRLLGAPCPTYGESERLWRGFMRTSEEPWIRDHQIQGSIIYPAAGYLCAAIEAACQLAAEGQVVRDFRLRDVQIIAPALFTEESDLELIVQLRPHLIGTQNNSSTWDEFTVSSCLNGQSLRQNCHGLILIEYKSSEDSGMSTERALENQTAQVQYSKTESLCSTRENTKDFYTELASVGLNYGSTFQNITKIHRGRGNSCCDVGVSELAFPAVSGTVERPHIIHPTTLDAMFHAVFAAYKDQKGRLREAMVPTSIDEMVVSANAPFEVGSYFKGFANASKHGFRELMANLVMLDKSSNQPAVTLKGFCFSAISGSSEASEEDLEPTTKKLFSKMVWKPAVELLSLDQKKGMLNGAIPKALTSETVGGLEKSEKLALHFIGKVLERVSMDAVTKPYLQEFYRWMQEQQDQVKTFGHFLQTPDEGNMGIDQKTAALYERDVISEGAEGEALCRVGQNLEDILLGSVNAADLLLEDELIARLQHEVRGLDECIGKIGKFVNLLAHNNPELSVLELGTARGSLASSLFSSLPEQSDAMPSLPNYVFSASNEGDLQRAKEILTANNANINFKALAIEKELTPQGFEGQTFDMIIASNPLRAQDDEKTLTNMKKLLKPDGKLCLVNVARPATGLSMVFRCLASSMNSQYHYPVTRDNEALDVVLKRNKLHAEFGVSDTEDARYQHLSLAVATQGEVIEQDHRNREIVILEASNPSKRSSALATQLIHELEDRTIKTNRMPWGRVTYDFSQKECISLLELEESFLEDLNEADFSAVKRIILDSAKLTWVTALDGPANAVASGMARSIRSEIPGKSFRSLQVQDKSLDSPEKLAFLVGQVATTDTPDSEFREDAGVLQVCRMVEDSPMNEVITQMLVEGKDNIENMALEQVSGPQMLAIRAQGMLDTLCVEDDDAYENELGEDEIEIEVKATGLNFRDVMVAMGQIPDSLLGFEASGIIKRVGRDVTDLKTGDSVCTLGHGCHRTLFRNKAIFCQRIPNGISFADASTLPLVHCTAFYALVHVARVRPKQSVLIHAAAGGVGQAAIQIAKHFKLEIFATVGSSEKRNLIQEQYDIPDDHIFNSRDLSFEKGVLRMTNGRGVDCILNSLSGEALRRTWRCIAPFGTFIEIGMKDILGNSGLEMRPFLQDATFTFFNIKHVMTANPELMAEIIEGTFDFLRQGISRPVSPITIYPVSEVESAFRLMQTGKHRGKIAITWDGKDVVPVLHRADNSLKLDGNATYVLVGGLGGLGRSLSNLLVDLGARNLCFISRSGDQSTSAQKLIQMLEQRNVKTGVHRCNIADKASVAATISHCAESMPPIKGVIQCAMVLRDVLFEKMTHTQWTESLRPKVQGTWNLHNILPKDLDFFVTLSSFAGIFGNRTQSNYAAASAYQDALAHYRRAQGLKAVTIDLGIMRDVGVIAENGSTDYFKEWEEPFGIRETELHVLIKKIIAAELQPTNTDNEAQLPPQVLTGFATGGTAHMANIRRPWYFDDPRFAILAQTGLSASSSSAAPASGPNGVVALRDLLPRITTPADAEVAMRDALIARVAKSLQTEMSEIDEGRPLHSYGVDSLVAVEIANWFFKEVKVSVSVFDILASMPITALAGKVVVKSPYLPADLMTK